MADAGAAEVSSAPRICVLGSDLTAFRFSDAVAAIEVAVRRRTPAVVSAATAYSVVLASTDPSYRKLVNASTYITTDGMPLVWLLRALGYSVERVHNDDLFLACCDANRKWRHFLVGGREGQGVAVKRELETRFPGIVIAGHYPTPVRPVPEFETARILQAIHEADADIVWVGMGTPAQDVWMAAARTQLQIPLCAVGSSFDLLAGLTHSAPQWVRNSGLQWLFRLCQEPRRLARRYLVTNTAFVIFLAWRLIQRRLAEPVRK